MLSRGGNAFDAAVAAGFAAAIAEPLLTSLGGGGFLLARTAEGEEILFDFFTDTPGKGLTGRALDPQFLPITIVFPGSEQLFNVGFGSAAVPGVLKGLLHVHSRLGRMELSEVVAPAMRLASEGAVLNTIQAYLLELLTPIVTQTPESRALYQREGRMLQEGELLRNPDLADFLGRLADGGGNAFYEGDIARTIAADMRGGGGIVTEEDLRGYEVIERTPLSVDYRGRHVLTNPPPSFGGSLIALLLSLFDEGPAVEWGSTAHLSRLAASMRVTNELRSEGIDSPEKVGAANWESVRDRVRSTQGTTQTSVSDAEGNVASMTTSNGQGCGYIVPGTGVMLNNMLGEEDLHPHGFHAGTPGERVSSMMSPSVVLEGGHVRLVLGSGGSKRIRTAIAQVIMNMIQFSMPLADAVAAPRMHWDDDRLHIEPGYPNESILALRQNWPVNEWSEQNLYFGGVHAVSPDGEAAADPRRHGYSIVGDE